MTDAEFFKKKGKLFQRLSSVDELDENLEESIVDIYGSRGKRAIEVYKEGGVRKQGERWFVQGREDEYEIVKSFCSCYDYVLNITTGKAEVDMCYHALAKNIQELLDFG